MHKRPGMRPRTAVIDANGTKLYCEIVGEGPPALFIAGSTGDAGNFTRTAELLASEFTVVTYDRRGNSRSPRPAGWTTTSVSEQADDAAGLIHALGLDPVCLFAASAGALIGLELAIRNPSLFRGAVLQEPSLFSLLPNAAEILAPRRRLIAETMQAKGPRATVEALLQHLNGATVLSAIPPDVLERMMGNGDTMFNIETAFASWRPSDRQLASISVPVVLMIAQDTQPGFVQVMTVLEARLNTKAVTVPGPHGFYYFSPSDLAEAVRPHFHRFLMRTGRPINPAPDSGVPPTLASGRR
jgi:pimeloyl-ACP methyl ester carboxylesterase